MNRYFVRKNTESLEVYVSMPLEVQPENSVLYDENIKFFKPVLDQLPPTCVIEAATEEEILEAREVPEHVPLWCLKAQLDIEGKLQEVETAIDEVYEPIKKKAHYIWEYGNFIHRSSATVEFIGQVLQMSKTDIDTLFINANNIEL